MILIDTHVALWIATNSALGKQSRRLLEQAIAEDSLAISAISFWEISLLIAKKRIETSKAPSTMRTELLGRGIGELPLTGPIAMLAVELQDLHGDPVDRFIAATAVAHDAMLMTSDRSLLHWRHKLKRHDASK